MTIKIDPRDRNELTKACTLGNYSVYFHEPLTGVANVLQATIEVEDPGQAFTLARMFETILQMRDLKNLEKKAKAI